MANDNIKPKVVNIDSSDKIPKGGTISGYGYSFTDDEFNEIIIRLMQCKKELALEEGFTYYINSIEDHLETVKEQLGYLKKAKVMIDEYFDTIKKLL